MYAPKLMLLVFNLILLVISVLSTFRGMTDSTPAKLRSLEIATGVQYFTRISTFGGMMLFTISLFGFWCIDSENRGGLITYNILLLFAIGLEVLIIFYYGFDDEPGLQEEIQSELSKWVSEYSQSNRTHLPPSLSQVQSYLKCCELPMQTNVTDFPKSCCPADIIFRMTTCKAVHMFSTSCSRTATKYFSDRESRYTWLLSQVIYPQIAAIIFAQMVSRKILLVQNLLEGKFPS